MLLTAAAAAAAAVSAGVQLPPNELSAWQDLGGRIHERICKCIIAHLDSHPLPFAGMAGRAGGEVGGGGGWQGWVVVVGGGAAGVFNHERITACYLQCSF
jgi:hypothetical protein